MVKEVVEEHHLNANILVRQDGEQMLKLIEQMDAGEIPCPDVVLLDLNLPRRTGLELLARMRASTACKHVPVVIITSSAAASDRMAAQRLGASHFFVKPSNFDDFMRLGEVIKVVMRGTTTGST